MADLVFQNSNGNDVTTSLIVAQVFGKEHKNVVRDIENLSCSENFNRLNFERITYKDARNREQTAYEMTKDGSAPCHGVHGHKSWRSSRKGSSTSSTDGNSC